MADIDAETLRKAAVAIWAVQREDLDKCDMELDDVGDHYDTFKMAKAAVASLPAPVAIEDADVIMRLQRERNRFRGGLLQIKHAAEDGRICDDVAWFSQYETLVDYIEGTLDTAQAAVGDLFQGALLDCPFCGGKAIRRDDPGVPDVPFGLVVDHKPECFLTFRDFQPDSVVDAAWNMRTSPAQGPAAGPRYRSECTCACHKGAGIMHVAPCCQPDPAAGVAVEMTREEHHLEFIKQMAAYIGPVVSFEFRESYYLASCDACGWVGSSELCGIDSWGDDSDVYCPRCQASGADCGKVAERIPAPQAPSAGGDAVAEVDREIGLSVYRDYLNGKLDDEGQYEGEMCAIHAAARVRAALRPARGEG